MRYDASASFSFEVQQLLAQPWVHPMLMCPEILGGLPCPRPPAEITYDLGDEVRIETQGGVDVTQEFMQGAARTLSLLQSVSHPIDLVILKDKSPSCGVGHTYSGAFDGRLVIRDGVCARLLRRHGYRVCSNTEIEELYRYVDIPSDERERLLLSPALINHPLVVALQDCVDYDGHSSHLTNIMALLGNRADGE